MNHTISKYWPRACCAFGLLAASSLVSAQTPASAPPPAPTAGAVNEPAAAPSSEQNSYLSGLTFGEQMHSVGITDQVLVEAIARGMQDGLHGRRSTQEERQQLQEFVHTTMEAAISHNQAAAKEFLERNGHDKGVVTTASGLEYKILLPGDKKAAAILPTDEVTVQYRGKLLDGTEFDSSYTRGAAATFVVSGVIKGWQEALVLMKPGAKWELYVPPALAYDATPKPGIPGGSLLIFTVELQSVKTSGAPGTSTAPGNGNKPPVKAK